MKIFFKKHTFLFVILAALLALLSNLVSGLLESLAAGSLALSFWSEGIWKCLISGLLLLLMKKWGYVRKSGAAKMLTGFAAGLPFLLFIGQNLWPLVLVNPVLFQVQWGLILAAAFCMFSVGLMEEAAMRGLVLPLLREKWVHKKHPCLWASLASSALFAAVHLNWSVRYFLAYGNLPAAFLWENLYQVYYAFCFGVLAAGVCVRAGSILPMALWHGLCDFSAGIIYGLLPMTTMESYSRDNVLTVQNVLRTYGIWKGFAYGEELLFGLTNLLFLIVGTAFILKHDKKDHKN